MMKWMKHQRDIVSLLTGIAAVFVGYFSWGLLTVFHKSGTFGAAGFLFSMLTMFLYALFCHSVVKLAREDICRQISVISGLGFLLCLLLLLRGGSALFFQREYAKLCMNILWLADFAGCCFYMIRNKIQFIHAGPRQHRYLYILLAGTALLLIEPDAMQFKWDGLLYHLACQNVSIDSISSLAIYGHIAQTYGMLNGLGALFVGDTAIAMIVINILLFLCSICAFYGIIKCVLPGKREFVYVLTTAVYAWSPFTLGMVFYHNLDFYCQSFFVIMLYFLYRRQWIYFFVTSMLFCFTKEPAIIIYAAVCAGTVILDWVDMSGMSFGTRFGRLLRIKRYYFMILPGILWFTTYRILGPWSAGEGGVQIDWAYVIEKLKALYVFQFNWLFSVICVCGAVYCIVKRNRSVWRSLFPILCGQVSFTVFSCLFKTVNHPRYNGTNQPALYLMAILLMASFLGYLYGQIVFGGIAVMLGVSSFYTIDPITLRVFPKYDIGDTVMVTTDKTPLGDGMIYNRQMLWLEHTLEMALKDALEGDDIVVFPSLENSTYFFDGMAQVNTVDGDYRQEQEYWNADENRRVTEVEDDTRIFTVFHLSEEPDWDRIAEKVHGRYSYCYLPCTGEKYAEKIRERFHILEEERYAYRGWNVYRICFE